MSKPGMELVRELLPATLLMHTPPGTSGHLEMDDGTTVPLRAVDMQAAGFGMFAKLMAKVGGEVLTWASPRMFDAASRAAAASAASAPPAPPIEAGGGDEQRREHDEAIPPAPSPAKKLPEGR